MMAGSWRVVGVLGFVLALVWLWPNLVHEPLHVLAASVQGAEQVSIDFDWSFPPSPTTTAVKANPSVSGVLFFRLLPSMVSVVLVGGWVWLSRRYPSLWMSGFASYLAFDTVMNALGGKGVNSDFRELSGVMIWLVIVSVVLLWLSGIIRTGRGIKENAVKGRAAQPLNKSSTISA